MAEAKVISSPIVSGCKLSKQGDDAIQREPPNAKSLDLESTYLVNKSTYILPYGYWRRSTITVCTSMEEIS
jgi:hypothetical protein